MNFIKKITVEAENRKLIRNLTMLPTDEEDTKALLCMDWLGEFIWAVQNFESTTETTDQSE